MVRFPHTCILNPLQVEHLPGPLGSDDPHYLSLLEGPSAISFATPGDRLSAR